MKVHLKNLTKILIALMFFIQSSVYAQDSVDYKSIEVNLDKYLTYFSDQNPGAVVTVIKKGDVLFKKAYGLSNVTLNEKMTDNLCFNIGELSKAFTSIAIMQLVEKNKMSLDNSLSDIFEGFPEYGNEIKIKNLLSHSSGLADYNKDSLYSTIEVLKYLFNQTEFVFEPGTIFQYSNSDYAVLAKIIETKSGMSYKEFIEKYIFKKLSMDNSFLAEDVTAKNNIAFGHLKVDTLYSPTKTVNFIYGEQGIYTNAADFAKWDKALYSSKLVKCENLSKIFIPVPIADQQKVSYYGLGWVLMEKNNVKYYWHGGSGNGYSNLILHLPDTQTTVLLLTNRNDGFDFLRMSIHIAKLFDKNLKL